MKRTIVDFAFRFFAIAALLIGLAAVVGAIATGIRKAAAVQAEHTKENK